MNSKQRICFHDTPLQKFHYLHLHFPDGRFDRDGSVQWFVVEIEESIRILIMHFYTKKNGIAQRYIQLTKKGVESKRYNTARAFKEGAVLGCTDTLKCLGDTNGLMMWFGKLGIQAGLESKDEESAKARMKELLESASNRGTEIHDAIDNYFKTGALPADQVEKTACIDAESFVKSKGISEYRSEHCFVFRGYINVFMGDYSIEKPDGLGWVYVAVGGTSDLVSPRYILDWKTIQPKHGKYRDPYAKEAAQAAMYGIGFGYPDADIINVYIDRESGHIVKTKEWSKAERKLGLRMFALAAMYKDIESKLEA